MILMKCIRLLHALRRIDHSVGAPNSTKSLKQIHVIVPTLLTKILIKTTMATQWQRSNRLGKLEPKRRDHILTKEQKKYCHFQRFWRYGDKGIWLVGKVRWSKFLGFKRFRGACMEFLGKQGEIEICIQWVGRGWDVGPKGVFGMDRIQK